MPFDTSVKLDDKILDFTVYDSKHPSAMPQLPASSKRHERLANLTCIMILFNIGQRIALIFREVTATTRTTKIEQSDLLIGRRILFDSIRQIT